MTIDFHPASAEAAIIRRKQLKEYDRDAEWTVREMEREEEDRSKIGSPQLWAQIQVEASNTLLRLAAKDYEDGSLPRTVITGFHKAQHWYGKPYFFPRVKQISLWPIAWEQYKKPSYYISDPNNYSEPQVYLGSDQMIYGIPFFLQHHSSLRDNANKKGSPLYWYRFPYIWHDGLDIEREILERALEGLRRLSSFN